MIKFEKDELLRIAKLSGFTLDDNEIESFRKHVLTVIDYSSELSKVSAEDIMDPSAKVNVFRKDEPGECNSEGVLEQAPEKDDNYFVVPKIL